jgi:hypothetical protein
MNKNILSVSILLIVTILGGCSMEKHTKIQSVILPASQIDWVSQEGWTPTQKEIDAAGPAIIDFIKIKNEKIYSNLDKYRCQYFGIYKDKRKRIYCNFFYFTDNTKNWKSNAVIVFDGGDAYFHLEYDMENKECLNFRVNGQA